MPLIAAFPWGGASIVSYKPGPVASVPSEANVLLTGGEDPIRMSAHQQRFGMFSESCQTSFLAQTTYGHALVGTVFHAQLASAGGSLIYYWVGAGGGELLHGAGGSGNITAAVSPRVGIWPRMVQHLAAILSDENSVGAIQSALSKSDPIAAAAAVRTSIDNRDDGSLGAELPDGVAASMIRYLSSKSGPQWEIKR